MTIKDLIKMSINGIKQRKFRSFLTMLSIGMGTMLFLIIFGIGNGSANQMSNQVQQDIGNLNRITVLPNSTKIYDESLKNIKGLNGVSSISASVNSRINSSSIGGKSGKACDIVGFNIDYTILDLEDKNTLNTLDNNRRYNKESREVILAGTELTGSSDDEVLVGQKYLDKMGITNYSEVIGKEIDLNVNIPPLEEGGEAKQLLLKGKIVGVLNGDYPLDLGKGIVASSKLVEKIQNEFNGVNDYLVSNGYSRVTAYSESTDKVRNITNELTNMNYGVNSGVDAIDRADANNRVMKTTYLAVGIIVLVVASFSLVNTLIISVEDKKKYIGIMKAIGASKANIRKIFLMDSAVIGFLGSVFGVTIGLILTAVINGISKSSQIASGIEEPIKMIILPVWFMIISIILTVIIAVIGGIIPSRKAAKLDPVELLSYE